MYDIDINKINPALQPILEKLFAAFPATNGSALTVLTYMEDLSDQPSQLVAEAATNLRRNHKFSTVPSIAEILSEVQRLKTQHQANTTQKWLRGKQTQCLLCHDTSWVAKTRICPYTGLDISGGYFCKCGATGETDFKTAPKGEPMPEFYKEALKEALAKMGMPRISAKAWHEDDSDSENIPWGRG